MQDVENFSRKHFDANGILMLVDPDVLYECLFMNAVLVPVSLVES